MKGLNLFFLLPTAAVIAQDQYQAQPLMIAGGVMGSSGRGIVMVGAGPGGSQSTPAPMTGNELGGVGFGGRHIMTPPRKRKAKVQGDEPQILPGIYRPRTLSEKK
ncbi:hypothetical protein FKW77_009496 [Venturia effusa]|uniref:Uncharacterized protein n=1 Tax=Venturia effusa TaxID=50376 RepID=A0A517LD06_9PEZI|nr:hypothetical protein FKW77_009496 [Venturia effusa]